jgi:ribonuclease BN (tRNA processing enzyme)
MRFTVLGAGAACPPAGQNSSGYLVEERDHRLLLDCGHGVASALLRVRPDFDIDDIVISHMHADHFIDVIPLRFRITRDMAGCAARPVRLHLPPGGIAAMTQVMRAVSFPDDFCSNTFDVHEYDPSVPLALGPFTVRFAEAAHYIPAWSSRVESPSASLVYTGDTAPADAVTELAMDCSLLVAEGTLDEPETGPARGHLTPEQAAMMACSAKAQRLLLTHFWYGTDLADFERRAAQIYTGPLGIATDGMSCDV